MKLARFSTMLAVAVLSVVATHAEAASSKPKPAARHSCPGAVTDPAGDANGVNPGAPVPSTNAGPSIDPLDILSIDLGTSKKTMVWVMQVQKLALTSPSAPTGMFWLVHFTIRKTSFSLTAHSDPVSGITYDLSYATATGGGTAPGVITGAFDLAHNQIRLVVPTATLAKWEPSPLRSKITGIGGVTGQELLAPGVSGYTGSAPRNPSNAVDWTTTDGAYTPGNSSCAKSG
jgi:hypothetical protein